MQIRPYDSRGRSGTGIDSRDNSGAGVDKPRGTITLWTVVQYSKNIKDRALAVACDLPLDLPAALVCLNKIGASNKF
jgi:hypothetical protein